MMDVAEVAILLKCEPAKVEELLRAGTLPGTKFGRSWVIPKTALMERLHDIALEESAIRRQPRTPRPPAPSGRRPLPGLDH